MKLMQRLFYYVIGFVIGLMLLFLFLGEKKTSFDYSPNARVLKNIRIKKRHFSTEAINAMKSFKIDTADISSVLKDGDVDFSKSNTKLDSCKTYFVEGKLTAKTISLFIENCDSIAKINQIAVSH